jgi:hypothetical protein
MVFSSRCHKRRRLPGAIVLMAIFFAANASVADAESHSTEIRWTELAPLIVGHTVTIPVERGLTVGGEVLSVREDVLMLDVRRTSDSRRYPKGQAAIPRSQVTEVRLVERRGSGGRILGTVVGAIVGVTAGGALGVSIAGSTRTAIAAGTATAVGCTVGGYFVGRGLDVHTRVLRIAPPAATSGLSATGDRLGRN